jgi:predicted nucleic acid-binding protein
MIVFDSSLLIAFHNNKDVHHGAASAFMERFRRGEFGRGLLIEYVFLEVMTVLTAKIGLDAACEVGQILLTAIELDFLPCSDFFNDTWDLFRSQRGTAVGFADAAILAAARKHAEGKVASFDAAIRATGGIQAVC